MWNTLKLKINKLSITKIEIKQYHENNSNLNIKIPEMKTTKIPIIQQPIKTQLILPTNEMNKLK